LRVLSVVSEVYPLIKTGGLADVAGALPAALARESIEMRTLVPGYPALVAKLEECSARLDVAKDHIRIRSEGRLKPADISTEEYPGFPTDMQAQFMALATQADGTSIVTENIFENRFMHVQELNRMGANITVQGRTATVRGGTPLQSAAVMCSDLRASASLVLAALVADGESILDRVYHIDRGYERIEEKLRGVGAQIRRMGDVFGKR